MTAAAGATCRRNFTCSWATTQAGCATGRWFDKKFDDEIGYPDFLFEWTVLLFKNGQLRETERKAAQPHYLNT